MFSRLSVSALNIVFKHIAFQTNFKHKNNIYICVKDDKCVATSFKLVRAVNQT